jgi:hypothetical protein
MDALVAALIAVAVLGVGCACVVAFLRLVRKP